MSKEEDEVIYDLSWKLHSLIGEFEMKLSELRSRENVISAWGRRKGEATEDDILALREVFQIEGVLDGLMGVRRMLKGALRSGLDT